MGVSKMLKFYVKVFYVMGKALSGELSCMWTAGLEKLTNANRSVSKVNDRLFLVELTENADWQSLSEYMLHSNCRKFLTVVLTRILVHVPI